MPSVRITNYTSQPLNTALKHICALHFENGIQPGQTIKLKNVGKVWFTLEVLVDDPHGKNRYSAAASAATIAIVSIAAVAAAAPVAVGVVGGGAAIAAGGTAIAAGGSAVAAGLGTALTAVQAFVTSNAGTIAKVSAAFVPKAIEIVEKEVGGFSAVQKEVVNLLSNPDVAKDVKSNGLDILSKLAMAFSADHQAEHDKQLELEQQKERERQLLEPPPPYEEAKPKKDKKDKGKGKEKQTTKDKSKNKDEQKVKDRSSKAASESYKEVAARPSVISPVPSGSKSQPQPSSPSESSEAPDSPAKPARPSLKALATSTSALLQKLSQSSHKEGQDAWEHIDFDPEKESVLDSKEMVRVYGLFIGERKEYEVREKEGKLVIIDAVTREVVSKERK